MNNPAAATARVWSHYQEDVFDAVANGTGHLVVRARAGSGKTTVIMEALRRVDPAKRVLLCAFNKSIAEELEQRAPAQVTVRTLHSLGYAALRAAWGKVGVSKDREMDIVRRVTPSELRSDHRGTVARLIGLAKANLLTTSDDILALAAARGMLPDWDAYCDGNWKPRYGDRHLVEWVQKAMAASRERASEVSFDDMVYAPAALQMRSGPYDMVFVDETQDMSAAQLALAKMALGRGGRLVAVGDDRQAIYGFRGADAEAMPRIVREMAARTLPLSISYRCPVAVADLARRYVPDFESPPSAPAGEVAAASIEVAARDWREGDFVLSRTNAPLVPLCLRALRDGRRARVQGRDIGAGLTALVRKSGARTMAQLLAWVGEWEHAEVAKLEASKRSDADAQVDAVRDRADTLRALCEDIETIAALEARIAFLFDDAAPGARLMFSTVHRAKGLEADRVWLLAPTFRPEHSDEEANLWYVAVTRSMRVLRLVNFPERRGDRDERR